MKCIYCQNDATYKERQDRACPRCKHKFAFEPKAGDAITDVAFAAAIARVSAQETVSWVPDHLYYELNRVNVSHARNAGVFGFVLLLLISVGLLALAVAHEAYAAFMVLFLSLMVLAAVLVSRIFAKRQATVRLSRADFARWWVRWNTVHGAPKCVVRTVASPRLPRPLPADVATYSFDRAVVCDRPETVDVLIANRFHFENNCAVLGVDGYPAAIFDTVRTMLRRNPKLQVYALHDATVEGCALAHRLATDPAWFAGTGARIVDVGLRPGHAAPFRNSWQQQTRPVAVSPLLTPVEQRWLARYTLELAVIRPEQLVKRLYRAITGEAARDTADASGGDGGGADIYVDTVSFSSDASSSDGGDDGFG